MSSDVRDPLAAFDDEIVATTATDADVPQAALDDMITRQQELVREYPGVDNLVFEWRRAFPNDPLVRRTERAYYLVVGEHVWTDFQSRLDLSDDDLRTLRTVHERQFRVTVGEDAASIGPDAHAIVLTRV